MLEVTNIAVYDLVPSVIASGYAMRTKPLTLPLTEYTEDSEEFKKGIKRLIKLNKASKGDIKCHNHALCGIRVSFDVKYPQYWTPEAQRYNFWDIVTSASKMHRLFNMDLSLCCNKYTDPELIAISQRYIEEYKNLRNKTDVQETQLYPAFMKMVSNCPLGLELFERCSTNYLTLQNVYFQRRHHKLIEDWQYGFCQNFIEKLPYFKELILGIDEEIEK